MSETATTATTSIEEEKGWFITCKGYLEASRNDLAKLHEPLEKQIAELRAEFQKANAYHYTELEAWERKFTEADQRLRDIALAHFETTGEKTFDENLSVRVNTKLVYEMPKAVEWAEQNAPVMIVKAVDKKSFESLPTVADLDFVYKTETTVPVIKGL